MSEFTRVGQIVGAFGLKGLLKVQPMTDFLDRFQAGSRLRLDGDWVEIESSKIHKKRPLIKLNGVNNAAAAEALQWHYLEVPALDKPELEEDEFLSQDLLGLKVVTDKGRVLGHVDQVLQMPAHDVIVVGELMIPAVKEFVKDIDFDTKTMTVKLIPGMLEDEE